MPERDDVSTPEETQDPEFQFVLRELLNAYRPILEAELERAKDPKRLEEEERQSPPGCDEELAQANRLLDAFFSEKTVLRLLPEQARELLGPVERWRWCFRNVRCCLLFGWLVCRGPRTFRAFVYYLYRYWLCVRRGLDKIPDARELTQEEREDFRTVVRAFAAAYRPYLTDHLATV